MKKIMVAAMLLAAIPASAQIELIAGREYTAAADRLRRVDAGRLEGLHSFIGGPPVKAQVTLASTRSSLADAAPEWASGYALPSAGVIVLFPERNPIYPDDSLEETYLHELAHVMIHRASAGGAIPRWFHEGVATAAGRAWTLDDWRVFAVETLISGTPSHQTVDVLFTRDAASARQAYALSFRFVRDLTQKYGETVVRDILRDVARGETFDRAFFNGTLLTPDTAWTKFREGEMQSGRLIPVLTSSFLLWILITVIAIAAIIRRRRRDTLQTTLWELEEELADSRLTPADPFEEESGDTSAEEKKESPYQIN